MKIALDFYNTITKYPELFWQFVHDSGAAHDFLVLSAVRQHNTHKLQLEVEQYHLNVPLEIVVFETYDEVPQLKASACLRLGVSLLIDDREDTCRLASQCGILALQTMWYTPTKSSKTKGQRHRL